MERLKCEYGDSNDARFHVQYSRCNCGVMEAHLCPKCMLEALPRRQGDPTDLSEIVFEGSIINIDQARSKANELLKEEELCRASHN